MASFVWRDLKYARPEDGDSGSKCLTFAENLFIDFFTKVSGRIRGSECFWLSNHQELKPAAPTGANTEVVGHKQAAQDEIGSPPSTQLCFSPRSSLRGRQGRLGGEEARPKYRWRRIPMIEMDSPRKSLDEIIWDPFSTPNQADVGVKEVIEKGKAKESLHTSPI